MQSVFMEELDDFVVVYLDDVLIFWKSREEHLRHLRHVFQRMRDQRLFVKLSKCDLAAQRVQYLGFVIEPNGVSADPDKMEVIRSWSEGLAEPKTASRFCGFDRLVQATHSQLQQGGAPAVRASSGRLGLGLETETLTGR